MDDETKDDDVPTTPPWVVCWQGGRPGVGQFRGDKPPVILATSDRDWQDSLPDMTLMCAAPELLLAIIGFLDAAGLSSPDDKGSAWENAVGDIPVEVYRAMLWAVYIATHVDRPWEDIEPKENGYEH